VRIEERDDVRVLEIRNVTSEVSDYFIIWFLNWISILFHDLLSSLPPAESSKNLNIFVNWPFNLVLLNCVVW
jgi:hypothetical protein